MLTTLLIALREYLEVFLIIGVFLGISKKMNLHRGKEIFLASLVGIILSLIIPITFFLLGNKAKLILDEERAELLGSYLMVFSGLFIAYVVFSLHKLFVLKRSKSIIDAHQKLQKNVFDISLFLTIVFFILKEGFEVALFTATTSLFAQFMENVTGLFIGFSISAVIGLLTCFAYIRFPIGKIFKTTEYLIILLGAALVKNGLVEIVWQYAHVNLNTILAIPLQMLPSNETYLGHLIRNVTGLEREFSLVSLAIMAAYIAAIYIIFLKKSKQFAASQV